MLDCFGSLGKHEQGCEQRQGEEEVKVKEEQEQDIEIEIEDERDDGNEDEDEDGGLGVVVGKRKRKWQNICPLPGSGGCSACVHGSSIYVFLWGRCLLKYDVDSDSYLPLAALPLPEWHGFAVCAVAGERRKKGEGTVDVDTRTRKEKDQTSSFSSRRRRNDKEEEEEGEKGRNKVRGKREEESRDEEGSLFAIGGTSKGKLTGAFFRFDLSTFTWHRLPDLPAPTKRRRLRALALHV